MTIPPKPSWATTVEADAFGFRATTTINGVEFAFRWIPQGEDILGSPEDEPGRFHDEAQYVFRTDGFWLDETAVTNAQWAVVMGEAAPSEDQARLPKTNITFYQTQLYHHKLSKQLNAVASLPTESQWEYAARAGTDGPTYGPLDEIAVYNTDRVAPVATKKPNKWGLFDMIGNVWEWCTNDHEKHR